MKVIKSSIVYVLIFCVVSFFVYNNRDSYSTSYKPLCVGDCVKQDMTSELENGNYIYILESSRFSNFALKYSNYTATGAFYLTANYKDDNGDIVRVTGMSFDIDKSQMSWPFIGDAAISYEDGKIFITGNKKIFESVSSEFRHKLDDALYNMKLVASQHDDELKPKKLLNGQEK